MVVNDVTGEPIGRALVEITGSAQRAMLTGNEGRFHFDGLAPGQVIVVARKPGFNGRPTETRRDSSYISAQIGPHAAPLTIRLMPESVIAGHVENAAGEPLEGATIRVLAPYMKQGRRHIIPMAQATTDEDGDFRIANLYGKRYYVALLANRPQGRIIAPGNAPKEGYPAIVYFPSAVDLSGATPLQLIHGQQTEIQFLLKKEPVYRIAGTMNGVAVGDGADVSVKTAGGEDLDFLRYNGKEPGSFEIVAVPAGNYVLEASSHRSPDRPSLHAALPVTVASDLTGIHLPVEPMVSIPVSVRAEVTQPQTDVDTSIAALQRSIQVRLHSSDMQHDAMSTPRQGENQQGIDIVNVAPGAYWAEVISWGPWYVQSVRCGSLDLLREPLVVPRGAPVPAMEVVLRDDSSTVAGQVQSDSNTSGGIVLLASESAPAQLPQIATTDPNGRFTARVAPGRYKVFAFDTLDQLEYANPEVLRQYDSKAAQITVTPNGRADITVELNHVEE